MERAPERLYLVVPCYNEEAVLPETSKRLLTKLAGMAERGLIREDSRILFVNDGSKDRTWELIEQLHHDHAQVEGLKLSRNRGHQNALLAGLMMAKERADMVISLDADLQDDVDVIDQFVEAYYAGNDIVYGVRSSRQTDTAFKRGTANFFYKFMKLLGADVIENHADYRLMSRRALEGLAQYREVNLFLRGIIPLIGYPSTTVAYERHERFAGESKYPLKKMLALSFDGITSFSVKPIRFIVLLGFLMALVGVAVFAYILVVKILGHVVGGWTSLIASIWLLGGVQLLCLGVIGEYIGKIYNETKARPRFIVEKSLIADEDKETSL
ncbi:MAG: glycosyltransferase family 2 protein [Christensenellales bacterium]|jgi:glycosyltransferase involved in cell wall biosynthesis